MEIKKTLNLIVCACFGSIGFCYSQKSDSGEIERRIDSIISIRIAQKPLVFHECDSVRLLDNSSEFKCWTYHYINCDKKNVFEVSISFNNMPKELIFYYENNKIIKRQSFQVFKGHSKPIWTIYYAADNPISYKGNDPEKDGHGTVEEGYYFLNLAIKYLDKITCR